jgi:hypothetical protein
MGNERDSSPGWHKAKELAKKVLKEATLAWDQYHEGMLAESKISAERAVRALTERYISRCFSLSSGSVC